ncbi:MAG TPA: hypothetical protein VK140_05175 [Ktedonobacteraceae bacterium]|nr:hypothetical protein [Ktedonobacteraceae bacterium]
MQENVSEVARLLEQIELEYQAAQRALTGLAIVSRHAFITARMENMEAHHQALEQLVGEEEAIKLLLETIENS